MKLDKNEEESNGSSGLIGDQPTNQDYLGFKPYVLAVAAFLTDPSTIPPLTLSVEGEWGCGKSSFLKQLKEELAKQNRYFFSISFNPWRYSENEALWAAFAVEFERQIYDKVKWYRKLLFKFYQIDRKKLAWDLSKLTILPLIVFLSTWLLPTIFADVKDSMSFKTVAALFILISAIFPVKEAFKELQEKLTKNVMSLKIKDYLNERPNYSGKVPFLDKFHEDIQKIATNLCGNDPIYVFIDDLDRCEPGQALELMQALNLLISDELKIIFILAIDRKKVAAGYAAKHINQVKYLDPFDSHLGATQAENFKTYAAIKYGYEFLEKFIQVPFRLPIPKEPNLNQLLNQIVHFKPKSKLVKNNFSKTFSTVLQMQEDSESKTLSGPLRLEEDPEIAQDIMAMIAPALGYNPRRIKKFFNVLRLQIYISSQTGLFAKKLPNGQYELGWSLIQLAKVLLISQEWPHLIEQWQKSRTLISYIYDYLSKENWSDDDLKKFKGNVCFAGGFKEISEDLENYWNQFYFWCKHKKLTNLLRYKVEEDPRFRISTLPITEFLEVSAVYKTERISISPAVAGQPLGRGEVSIKDNIKSIFQNLALQEKDIRNAFDKYSLNLMDLKEGEERKNSEFYTGELETKNPITGEWEDSPKTDYVGKTVSSSQSNPNSETETENLQSDTKESPVFSYDTDGHGYDDGFWQKPQNEDLENVDKNNDLDIGADEKD